jgi:DMSO reductase anchor subunit
MTKKKDYFTAIVMGSLWTIVCLLINWGAWWIIFLASDSNSIITCIFTFILFCIGMYIGRDFFKVEMRTVRANDPKTDWLGILDNVQMLLLAGMFVNSINIFDDGFTWAGLGAFICGLIFVWMIVYMKNTRFPK